MQFTQTSDPARPPLAPLCTSDVVLDAVTLLTSYLMLSMLMERERFPFTTIISSLCVCTCGRVPFLTGYFEEDYDRALHRSPWLGVCFVI